MNKSVLITVLLLSQAAISENLIKCPEADKLPWKWRKCSLDIKEISGQPVDSGKRFHADYTVTYSYDCQGNETDFGIASGSSFKRFRMGAINETILGIAGDRPLKTYDPNPSLTKKLGFKPGCSLEIHNATMTPSFVTLNLWNTEARAQAKIIRYAMDSYELARDFTGYRDWDIEKTRTMLDSLNLKIPLMEKRCKISPTYCIMTAHLKVLKNSLEQKINQTPNLPPVSGDESRSIVQVYKESLDREVSVAKSMIQRFDRWDAVVNQELVNALAQVPN